MSEKIKLPLPRSSGDMSLEQALSERRSVRRYTDDPLELNQLSQLLWAAQGVTHPRGFRTAPSAGALYPLEIYVAAGKVRDLRSGVYRYLPSEHALIAVILKDIREVLRGAALRQTAVSDAPAVMVFCAVYERVASKYGQRGTMYVHMEAGHAAQNLILQATSLGLASVVIGAFEDSAVKKAVNCSSNEQPVYLVPVGRSEK